MDSLLDNKPSIAKDLIKGPRASKKRFDSLKTARTSSQGFQGFLD